MYYFYKMAHLTGVEPIAFWSVVRRSIQLSYRCIFTSNSVSELLPLLEAGTSWKVSAFVSQIYLPSSSGSSYPDVFSVIHFAININQKCNLSPIYRKPTTSYYLFVKKNGGEGGIWTLDPSFSPDTPLAGERIRPLCHFSKII